MGRLLKFPVNYRYGNETFSINASNVRTGAAVISDNDFTTSSTLKSFIFETHGDSATTRTTIDYIFIRCTGVDNYSISIPTGRGTGTGTSNRAIPSGQVINNIQYDLFEFGPLSATEVRLDLVGSTTRLYDVMLLENIFETQDNATNINISKVDRGSILRTNIKGNSIKVPGLSRSKWSADYTYYYDNTHNPSAEEVIRSFDENPNFTWVQDFSRWPSRCYAATLSGGLDISYLGGFFNQIQLSFSITRGITMSNEFEKVLEVKLNHVVSTVDKIEVKVDSIEKESAENHALIIERVTKLETQFESEIKKRTWLFIAIGGTAVFIIEKAGVWFVREVLPEVTKNAEALIGGIL